MTPRQAVTLSFAFERSSERFAKRRLRVHGDFVHGAVFRDAAVFQDGQRIAEATHLDRIVCHQDDGETEF